MQGERNQEAGITICTLLYIKYIISKNLLYSTGNSIPYFAITSMGKNLKKHWALLIAQTVKNLPAMWETWVHSLG